MRERADAKSCFRLEIYRDFQPKILLLVFHSLADFLTEHTLNFILHRFGAGFAEMRPDPVGGLADFLHH